MIYVKPFTSVVQRKKKKREGRKGGRGERGKGGKGGKGGRGEGEGRKKRDNSYGCIRHKGKIPTTTITKHHLCEIT